MKTRELYSVCLFLLGIIMIVASSIPAKATGKPHAEFIEGPGICYAIYDSMNKIVGGNCR